MSDFADLMAKDPLSLTEQDIETVVSTLRQQRARYVLGDKKVGTPEPRKSKAQKERETKALALDLGDLL